MSARLTWLIERCVFEATAARLIAALDAKGDPWVDYRDDLSAADLPASTDQLVFYGSLNLAQERRDTWPWRPGVICNVPALHCSTYYPHLGAVLLNQRAEFTTVAELVEAPGRIASRLGSPEHVFVRPDSPLKPFSGRVLRVDSLSLEALDHGFYYEDKDLPVVVSPAVEVGAEYRFVIVSGAVVAESAYSADGRCAADAEVPAAARQLADQVAAGAWHPDPAYVVDICATPDGCRVLELNSFSCSDLYACDFTAIVDALQDV